MEFSEEWGGKYPAIIRLWSNVWAEFVPLLQFDREIRRIVCTTSAIETVNARIRKAVKARGHFPNEQAALKCVSAGCRSHHVLPRGATGHLTSLMSWAARSVTTRFQPTS